MRSHQVTKLGWWWWASVRWIFVYIHQLYALLDCVTFTFFCLHYLLETFCPSIWLPSASQTLLVTKLWRKGKCRGTTYLSTPHEICFNSSNDVLPSDETRLTRNPQHSEGTIGELQYGEVFLYYILQLYILAWDSHEHKVVIEKWKYQAVITDNMQSVIQMINVNKGYGMETTISSVCHVLSSGFMIVSNYHKLVMSHVTSLICWRSMLYRTT